MKIKKSLSAYATLELLNKPWATIHDIQLLACCGYQKAKQIKMAIVEKKEAEKYYVPPGYVPMDSLKDYLNININYLKKIANIVERSESYETQDSRVL